MIPHMPILSSVKDAATGSYDFRPIFAPVAPYLARTDYTVANLETKLAGPGPGYSGYPLFNSPAELAYALRDVGVDLLATANNHALDMGWQGLTATLDKLDEAGLAHVGTYRSAHEKQKPFIVDLRGIRVAFLNYTASLNGFSLPKEHPYAVNLLDPLQVAEDAQVARLWGADVVIALLHFGNEYQREPDPEETKLTQELLSRGVDVIIGSHPHVVQPIA
ncbi:MAG: CapA family protein, partial [Thermoleophilia bacterium]|nr:CapA family protein [Thermoleophilia bacterium]